MKKVLVLGILVIPFGASAQNLQLHYDFGEGRKYFTATHEMFKADSLGSTFWFIDFDFNFPGSPRSMSAAYWEISREFYIPGLKKIHPFEQLGFHFEYNDGFTAFRDTGNNISAASYNSVFLTGFGFPVNIGNFSLTTQLLLRMPRDMHSPGFQLTLVWFQYILKEKVLLTGYMDFWSQDKILDPSRQELAFQSEPQFWFMIIPNIAVGSEIEISRNFPVGPNEWKFMPTLACRWEF